MNYKSMKMYLMFSKKNKNELDTIVRSLKFNLNKTDTSQQIYNFKFGRISL